MNLKTVALAILLTSTSVQCGVWEERALLERYANTLENLNQTLLVDAQQVADPNARIAMNYSALLHESNEIVRKIRHHLNSPLEEYRQINIQVYNKEVATK